MKVFHDLTCGRRGRPPRGFPFFLLNPAHSLPIALDATQNGINLVKEHAVQKSPELALPARIKTAGHPHKLWIEFIFQVVQLQPCSRQGPAEFRPDLGEELPHSRPYLVPQLDLEVGRLIPMGFPPGTVPLLLGSLGGLLFQPNCLSQFFRIHSVASSRQGFGRFII